MALSNISSPAPAGTAEQLYLQTCLRALRLRLQRRVLWLRRQWQHDPLQEYPGLVISESRADWLLAGEEGGAEAAFYREDPEALGLGAALAAVEQDRAALAGNLAAAGRPPAAEALVARFGLSPFERDVLLLCLAPELDPTFERLYAYVQDDVTRRYPTAHLALALLGDETPGDPASFLPEAPLRRFGLLVVEPGTTPAAALGARPLRLDDRIAACLRGDYRAAERPDERLAGLLAAAPPSPVPPDDAELAERLARALGAGNRWPLVNLVGPPDAGQLAVARLLTERLGLRLFQLDAGRLPASGPDQLEMLRLAAREALLLRAGLFVEIEAGEAAERASALVEHLPAGVLLVASSRERWSLPVETVVARVQRPDAAVQRGLWRQALSLCAGNPRGPTKRGARSPEDRKAEGRPAPEREAAIEAVVQQFDLGPLAIGRAAAAARARRRLRAPGEDREPEAEDLWGACRELAGGRIEDLAQRIAPGATWEEIVLPEEAFRQLEEIAAQVAHRGRVYEQWGFGARLSRGRGISALFSGPPGTGKTMAAEVLAAHLQLDLYRIDLSGVVSKYIGETEKNLRRVFDAAEESGAILFFDEADALFGKRTEVKDSHDRYANIEVNYLLQRMEDYRGLAILATNRKSALDRAFLRRLRFLLEFPSPDWESRRRIWRKVFPPQTPLEELDFDFLARMEIAGGNIRNIAVNAAFLAAAENAPVRMAHLMRAAQREYAKLDRMITEAEFGPYYRRSP
jgi:hypothetical protein